jgi:hypothetical protein
MIPATAMITRRMTRTMAVAGRTADTMAEPDAVPEMTRPPLGGGLVYTKESSVPWGGLGGYPFTPWTERALGMRGTVDPPSCMRVHYRSLRVVT